MGIIPEVSDWALQVNYQKDINDVKDLKSVDISQEDIDLAKLKGKDIGKIKKDRLVAEKKKLTAEINKKYGIKTEDKTQGRHIELKKPETRDTIMEMLQGKGLVNKGKK